MFKLGKIGRGGLMLWCAVWVAVLLLRWLGAIQWFELVAYDQLLKFTTRGQPDPRVVIVEIVENDIHTQHWPFSDQALASVLKTILQGAPRVVGIDLYRDLPEPPGREELDALFANESRIIGIRKMSKGRSPGIPPHPALAKRGRVGFNDLVLDSDNVVRRGLLMMTDNDDRVISSFGLRIALDYLAKTKITLKNVPQDPQQIMIGDTVLPAVEPNTGGYRGVDAAGYQILLDYRGGSARFDTVTFGAIQRGEIELSRFTDRIVLIGPHLESVTDHFSVPVGDYGKEASLFSFFSTSTDDPNDDSDIKTPGVVIHAHTISQLIRNGLEETMPLLAVPESMTVTLIIFSALVGIVLGSFASGVLFSLAVLLGGITTIGGLGFILAANGLWLPVIAPLLAWGFSLSWMGVYVLRRERLERGQLMQFFSNYLSPLLAENLWERRDEFLIQGRPRNQRLTMTALFLDMKGYTQQASLMEPDALMSWVNTFMEAMSERIAEHGGLVDDFFGDGIKADFGVPVPKHNEEGIRQDALNAVACAIDLGHQLERLNEEWRAAGLPSAGMRIGVHTGKAVAGCLGSTKRLKYTTVGAEVILAQRLESYSDIGHDFDKEPFRIIISEATYRYVADQVDAYCLGSLKLKGRIEPLTGYRLLGIKQLLDVESPVTIG
ncbi:adenylate cyclase [Gammaproteobacteria bacterium]